LIGGATKTRRLGAKEHTVRSRTHVFADFDNIKASMSSVAAIADSETVIVQMIAFSSPTWQLRRYLDAMEEAGLAELFLPKLKGEQDGRLWRSVPGRRWYSAQRGETPGSQEVVLFHRSR
jgi:hypothetical protein